MEKSVNFNRAAEYYDATRGFPEGIDKEIAAFMLRESDLNAQSIVLDIGIGTGRTALPLAPQVGLVTGIDISRDMLNVLLRKRQQEAVFPLEGDGHYLPYADKSFDAVVVVHFFHLVPDPLRV